MKLALLTLSLIAALTQGARASEPSAEASREHEQEQTLGSASFASVAPAEWPSAENFTNGARKETLDVVDSIMANDRLPAATATKQGSGAN